MEINVGDYYFEIDNEYILLIILIISIIGVILYRRKKNILILPLVLVIYGLLLKGHFLIINIGDTYYLISYFFIELAIAALFTLVYFLFKKDVLGKIIENLRKVSP